MLIGEPARSNPTVHVPTWDPLEDPTAVLSPALLRGSASVNSNGNGEYSSFLLREALTALQLYLPPSEFDGADSVDSFSGDEFRMFEFKVRRCSRGRSHDWTECPYAHPGEKARRRDPRRVRYSGTACPEFRRGGCRKGDACELAHGVFEIWLHPDRYRTQPCKDGNDCRRRVCFFAHTPDQLRILSHQSSPPRSPSVSELVASMRGVHIGETRGVSRYGSTGYSVIRAPSQSGFGRLDLVRDTTCCEEDDPVHRVSSGSLGPDVGWVSELVDTG